LSAHSESQILGSEDTAKMFIFIDYEDTIGSLGSAKLRSVGD